MNDSIKNPQSIYDEIWKDAVIEPGSLLNTGMENDSRNERSILGALSCKTDILGEEDRSFWSELAAVSR